MVGEGTSEQGSNNARNREDSSEGTEQLWPVFELCDVSDDGQAGRAVVLMSAGRLVGMLKYPQNASCSTAGNGPSEN